jgi:hypothetical protein
MENIKSNNTIIIIIIIIHLTRNILAYTFESDKFSAQC